MSWATRRRFFYFFILIVFLAVMGYLISYPALNKAPTCMDGKQNGDEIGPDCGGSCMRVCLSQVDPVAILWARVFQVIPGRYNAVAYLENHNRSAAIKKIGYRFRFADAGNVYIGKREGTTIVPPGGKFAVFEPGIDIGNSVPVYTTFEFTEIPEWNTVLLDKIRQLQVPVTNILLAGETTSPRLTATVKNDSFFVIPEMNIIAILYDEFNNAVTASRTYIGVLNPGEKRDISFTWPEPFSRGVVVKEIIPMYDIFSAQIKR